MNRKLKAFGSLLAPLVVGLSSSPLAIACEESSSHQHLELKAQSKGSVWLVYAARHASRYDHPIVMDKIEVKTMEDCNVEGSKLKANEVFKKTMFDYITYACVKGK